MYYQDYQVIFWNEEVYWDKEYVPYLSWSNLTISSKSKDRTFGRTSISRTLDTKSKNRTIVKPT